MLTITAFLYCTLVPVDAKVEAVFANFKYNLSEKTFIQFGVRDQEINNFQALDGFLPITQVVPVTVGGGMTIPFIPQNVKAHLPIQQLAALKLAII